MNRYPLWKYVIVAFALMIGFIYTLPNFFGESPAVQVSSAKATIKVDKTSPARRRIAQGCRNRTNGPSDANGVKVAEGHRTPS